VTAGNHLPDLAYRLILRAAHKAPEVLSERLGEEWLADLECQAGTFSRLRFAIGCSWATAVISREFRLSPALNRRGISPCKSLLGYLSFDLSTRARHVLTFIALASFQGFGLGWGYAHQLDMPNPTPIHASLQIETASQRDPATPFVEIDFETSVNPRQIRRE
jgi:hypothetical protein